MQNKFQYGFQYFQRRGFYPHSIVHSFANLFSLGITYQNVYEIQLLNYAWDRTINFWIAKHNGILKQQYNDHSGFSSWTIIKQNIIQ